jgi:hypothetical protein
MTTPVVTTVAPTKLKTWIALAGSVLATLVPIVLGLADYIPAQYAWVAAVIHAVIGLLTTLGVYQAPHHPADTSIVPNDQIITLPKGTGYTPVPDVPVTPVRPGQYRNPWRA